ncbi:MAG: SpoIVB peptidase [Oscillospiraceae bacterium]|jgi:stage IV sporulation protein B|nr:SpoIVB peptidase [Oscillospiraceae bacterium]
MRRFLRSASLVTATLLLPIFCLMFYVQLLLPDGGIYFHMEEMPFSVLANSAIDETVGAATKSANISQVRLFGLFPIKGVSAQVKQRRYVIPGGQVFGLKLYAKGVVVVAVDGVASTEGKQNPAAQADLRPGDLLLEIDGTPVTRNAQVSDAVVASGGKTLSLLIEREGAQKTLTFIPAKSSDGSYKAGIWVRDSSAGIGTVTFTDPQTNMLAGLGHAICDVDSGAIIQISSGEAMPAVVKGCYKGTSGKAGELCGVFSGASFAGLLRNGDTGVYGKLYRSPDEEPMRLPVALKQEVKTGKAQIIATVDGDDDSGGTARIYDAEIRKVYPNSGSSRKNMIIQVTDPELIALTGGIVQGMSGSPILQDGMLVGAVTHVFVNNPLQGYGIFAETMLETSDELAAGEQAEVLAPAA